MKEEKREDLIIGRNGVIELLKGSREVEAIFVQRGDREGSIVKLIGMAKDKKIPIKEVNAIKLDLMSAGSNHQGVIAQTSAYKYSEIQDIFDKAGSEAPFIIIADEIEDPHNLGAIIRTAECAGVHGIIIPKRHGVGLTFAVSKTSAGAIEHVPVVRVPNLSAAIDELKTHGVWIYGADSSGENYSTINYNGGVGLVIGSEGKGLGRLIKEKCDFLVSLPMRGKINSLNASVAAGIIMYEISKQRG